ncbi:hypothetical protein [Tissierella carlieri]|nr:hypothetical protein [Tissierella carlieri]
MEYTDPRNEIGLKALTEHYYEFELFDRIKDAEHVECCSLLVLKE